MHRATKSIARVVQYRPRDGTYKLLLVSDNLAENLHSYNKQYYYYQAKGQNRVLIPIRQVRDEWFKVNNDVTVITLYGGLR